MDERTVAFGLESLRRCVVLPAGSAAPRWACGTQVRLPPVESVIEGLEGSTPRELAGSLGGWLRAWLGEQVRPGAACDEIDASAVLAPGAWERALIERLADATASVPGSPGRPRVKLAALPGDAGIGCARPLFRRLRAWATADRDEGGLLDESPEIARAATPWVEARYVARRIRLHLGERPGAAVTVLAPDANRASLVAEALDAYGVPAVLKSATPLIETPAVRWLLALAELQAWASDPSVPVSRSALQVVLESTFYVAPKAADGEGRVRRAFFGDDVRAVLDTLRRPRVSLHAWAAHVRATLPAGARDEAARAKLGERAEALVALTEKAAGRAKGLPEHPVDRLRALLTDTALDGTKSPGLGVARKLRARRASAGGTAAPRWFADYLPRDRAENLAAACFERVVADLEAWCADEPGLRASPKTDLRPGLERRLRDAAVIDDVLPDRGVTVCTYDHFDGDACDMIVLTGLEDGGYPRAPVLPRRPVIEALARHGMAPGSGENASAPAFDTLEREIAWESFRRASATLVHALAAARDCVLMTFCAVDDGGRETYPGAFLLGIRAVANLADGGRQDAIETIDRRALTPDEAGEAVGPWEARACATPGSEALAAAIGATPAGISLIGDQAWGDVRRAGRGGEPSLDAYSGVLHGARVWDGKASATKLERYAACGYRFWLEGLLRLEARDEADDDPSPLETGSAVHEVLQHVFDGDAARDLFAPADRREGFVAQLTESSKEQVRQVFTTMKSGSPSLAPMLVDAYADRWERTLERYVRESVTTDVWRRIDISRPETWTEGDREDVLCSLTANDRNKLSKALHTFEVLTACRANLASFVPETPPSSERALKSSEAWKRAEAAGLFGVITKKQATLTLRGSNPAEALGEKLDTAMEKVRDKIANLAEESQTRWFKNNRLTTVLRCEYGFGLPEADREAPVEIAVGDGKKLLLRGRIDRVDEVYDGAGESWLICDYKSGKEKTSGALLDDTVAGLHLQLPLYASAAERIGDDIAPDRTARPVRLAGLAYPRRDKLAEIDLDEPVEVREGSAEQVTTQTVREVSAKHLAAYVGGLLRGEHPLLPRKDVCPVEKPFGTSCDFARVCRFDPAIRDRLGPGATPSHLEMAIAREVRESDGVTTRIVLHHPRLEAPEASLSREEAEASQSRTERIVGDLERDVVLTAGAGSGKTHQLVRRAIRAYAETSPLQVACITFTRKAAAEMRYRIRRALIDPGAFPHDPDLGAWVARAVDRNGGTHATLALVSAAPVTTIDGLCLRYAERLTARVPDLGTVSVDDGGGAELEEAFRAALVARMDAGDSRLRSLIGELPPAVARTTLFAFVRDWMDILVAGEARGEGALPPVTAQDTLRAWAKGLARWTRQQCEDRLRSTARTLVQQRCSMETLLGRPQPEEAWGDHHDTWVSYFREMETLREEVVATDPGDVGACCALASRLLWLDAGLPKTKKCSAAEEQARVLVTGKAGDGNSKRPLPSLCKGAKGPGDVAAKMREQLENDAEVAAIASALAEEIARAVLQERRNRGRFTHTEVTAWLGRQLRERPGMVAEEIPLRHLVVDEMQDSNRLQIDLFDRLAEVTGGARRFYVGDKKQSIYRFRGAEADEMDRLLARTGFEQGDLCFNRRSDPRLVEATNRLFATVFGAGADPDAALGFGVQRAARKPAGGSVSAGLEVLVTVQAPDAEKSEEKSGETDEQTSESPEADHEPDATERAVVARIVALVDGGARALAGPDAPPIAVLTPRWRDAVRYASLLRKERLRATCAAPLDLLRVREVADLRLALEALVRRDECSAAGWLRSPLVGLSDAGLWALRTGQGLVDERGEPVPAAKRRSLIGTVLEASAKGLRLDPAAVLDALAVQDAAGESAGALREALRRDARLLARLLPLVRGWEETLSTAGLAETARRMAVELFAAAAYRDVLRRTERGAEGIDPAVALDDFVAWLREVERTGLAPHEALRRLDAVESAEPDAGWAFEPDADVECTTVWQAKGRQWPVVVLVVLDRLEGHAHAEKAGILRCGKDEVLLPYAPRPDADDFFGSCDGVMTQVAAELDRAPARAETKRLLYVAMTRAMVRTIATLSLAPQKRCAKEAYDGVVYQDDRLDRAVSAEDLLRVALQLRVDEPGGEVIVGPAPALRPVADYELVPVESVPEARLRAEERRDRQGRAPSGGEHVWHALETGALGVLRPSSATGGEWLGEPRELGPVCEPDEPEADEVEGAFGSADRFGEALHALMQRAAFAQEPPPEALRACAAAHGLPGEQALGQGLLARLYANARRTQPDLWAQLRAAALRGDAYHEVRVAAVAGVGRVEGRVDLLWRDASGRWHLLDYKSGARREASRYAGQVGMYAKVAGLWLPGPEGLVSAGLWFVRGGWVVDWAVGA